MSRSLNNTRVPQSLRTISPQIASITLAGAEVIGLFDRYGRTLEACFDALMAIPSGGRARRSARSRWDHRHQEVI
jgi:hypothetical protein